MDAIKVTLCPACGGCPSVEITDEGVRIGEAENIAKLTHAEWNDLIARVRSASQPERSRCRVPNTCCVTVLIGTGRICSLR